MSIFFEVAIILLVVLSIALIVCSFRLIRITSEVVAEYENQLTHYRKYFEAIEHCLMHWEEEDNNAES